MTAAEKKTKSAAERMSSYRRRMRDEGLRPIQIWVPDLRKPDVLADYQRQARLIAQGDPAGDEALAWIEVAYEWPAQ